MKPSTPSIESRTETQIALKRALAQLEVAERNSVPGLEGFRRRVHDLSHGRPETFRNAGARIK